MKFVEKWFAIVLSAVLVTAVFSTPFTSTRAMGSDTASADEESVVSMTDSSDNSTRNDENDGFAEAASEDASSADSSSGNSDSEDSASKDAACQTNDSENSYYESNSSDGTDSGNLDDISSEDTGSEYPEFENSASNEDASDAQSEEDSFSDTGEEETAEQETASDISSSAGNSSDVTASGRTSEVSSEAAADAVQESTEEEDEILEEEPSTDSFVPVDDICQDTDNDDVFAAYVNQELELTGDLKMDTGDLPDYSNTSGKAYASASLTGYNRTLYANLYREIGKVAAGERTDTVFTVSTAELGLAGKYWTASDLGVSDIVVKDTTTNKNVITSESKTALDQLIGITVKPIVRSLISDCPYDLYWYDKTESTNTSGFGFGAKKVNGEWVIYYTATYQYTFKCPVSADYSAGGETNTYETNAEIGSAVTTAYETAHSIVDQYADCTDYEKMDGYREKICDLTSYNYSAINDSTTNYGDPWQLIWVFDQDDSTKVVCEGYAKGFQYLCDLSDWNSIFKECISVTGTLSGSNHMWNIVALRDGRSYLADLTNCDTGMVGQGNGRRNLFLVGTGDADATEIYAQGSLEDGYYFTKLSNLTYVYSDELTRARFDDEILTLAAGRVDESTTADGEYTGDHTHIYYNVEELAPTCTEEGHTAYGVCAICGAYDDSYAIIPATGHTAGEWVLTTAPTYETEGEETTNCTVCGETLSRSVDKLVHVSGVTLDSPELDFTYDLTGETARLTATILPENAANKNVTWSSSNTDVALVDSEGNVTAVNAGTAIITVTSEDCQYTADCKVTVNPRNLYDAVNAGTAAITVQSGLVYTGSPQEPSLTVTYKGRTLVKGTDYSLACSNHTNAGTARAAVTGTGNYTGTALADFTIEKAAQSFTVKSAAYTIYAGKTTKVTASGAKETPKITFTSSNSSVAAVNSAGTVTGKTGGTVTITVKAAATANYKAASKTVTINVKLKKPGYCHFVKWNNSKYSSCRIAWNTVTGAEGYQTLLSWTDGSHASSTIVKSSVLYRNCTAAVNHVSQMKVRAFYTSGGVRRYGPWSNVEYITPSPTKLTAKNVSTSSSSLKMKISWNIIYGCNGYNVFLTTNPNGTWYWNQSTPVKATSTGAVITKYRGSRLKKNTRYYVRIVTRRKRNGVFCTVPMPAANTNIGSFIIK